MLQFYECFDCKYLYIIAHILHTFLCLAPICINFAPKWVSFTPNTKFNQWRKIFCSLSMYTLMCFIMLLSSFQLIVYLTLWPVQCIYSLLSDRLWIIRHTLQLNNIHWTITKLGGNMRALMDLFSQSHHHWIWGGLSMPLCTKNTLNLMS